MASCLLYKYSGYPPRRGTTSTSTCLLYTRNRRCYAPRVQPPPHAPFSLLCSPRYLPHPPPSSRPRHQRRQRCLPPSYRPPPLKIGNITWPRHTICPAAGVNRYQRLGGALAAASHRHPHACSGHHGAPRNLAARPLSLPSLRGLCGWA